MNFMVQNSKLICNDQCHSQYLTLSALETILLFERYHDEAIGACSLWKKRMRKRKEKNKITKSIYTIHDFEYTCMAQYEIAAS